MFRSTYQGGLLSVFYSCGSQPLLIWDSQVVNGHIKRVTDADINSLVLEICSTNVTSTYISCPKGDKSLAIKLPFMVLVVKNLRKYFSFEITVLDDKNIRRRFQVSNYHSSTKIKPFFTSMPIGLAAGWNQIQFNLVDFTRRAYGTQYLETQSLKIHANVRLRRIYFGDRLYSEEELPNEFKLFLPLGIKKGKRKETGILVKSPSAIDVKAKQKISVAEKKHHVSVHEKKEAPEEVPVTEIEGEHGHEEEQEHEGETGDILEDEAPPPSEIEPGDHQDELGDAIQGEGDNIPPANEVAPAAPEAPEAVTEEPAEVPQEEQVAEAN